MHTCFTAGQHQTRKGKRSPICRSGIIFTQRELFSSISNSTSSATHQGSRPKGHWTKSFDSPKARHRRAEQIKYIPEYVLRQFEQHIQDLPPHYIPLAIILRATGWRISDVLLLKMEACLVHSEKGWWICGDIPKTNVLGHKVPITKEVAHVIEAQREWVKQTYSTETNPKGYLFPSLYGPQKARSTHDQ